VDKTLQNTRITVTGAGGSWDPSLSMPWPAGAPACKPSSDHRTKRRESLPALHLPRRSTSVIRAPSGSWSPAPMWWCIWPGRVGGGVVPGPVENLADSYGGNRFGSRSLPRGANRKLIYVSSAEVYGRPLRSPVGEDHPLSARSPYGAAKIGAEKLIEAFVHAFGLRAVILRPFSIYGPGASSESLIPRIIDLARKGLPVLLRDLRPVRDYCFVTDLAEATASACSSRIEDWRSSTSARCGEPASSGSLR